MNIPEYSHPQYFMVMKLIKVISINIAPAGPCGTPLCPTSSATVPAKPD